MAEDLAERREFQLADQWVVWWESWKAEQKAGLLAGWMAEMKAAKMAVLWVV
jgi:hypothetical protein